MESHPYEKTPGGGVSPLPVADPQFSARATCQYVNARGGRCRMFPSGPDSVLCPHHTRQAFQQQRREREALANDLLAGTNGNFASPDTVKVLLTNLLTQLARKRISRRDAITLAYIAQLLLSSLSALGREGAMDNAAAQLALRRLHNPPPAGASSVSDPERGLRGAADR